MYGARAWEKGVVKINKKITFKQTPRSPYGEWEVVQQLHPDEDGEPCWGVFEEFVAIGGYVELAQVVGEACLEEGW